MLRKSDEAIPPAHDIVTVCGRQEVAVDVANALAYLEQAVRAAAATADFVRNTRRFVGARLHDEIATMDFDAIS